MAPRKSETATTSAKKTTRRGSKVQARAKAVGTAVRSGLLFSVPRVGHLMKRDRLAGKIGKRPQIVLAAVMEYITSEILELAGNISQEAKKKRITPRHIMLSIANDEELSKIVPNAIFHESGVVPHIEPAMLKKAGKGGKEVVSGTQEI